MFIYTSKNTHTHIFNLQGNILNNYGDDDIVVDMIRLLMTVVICFTFPLCMVPARLSVDNLIFNTFECEMQGYYPKEIYFYNPNHN